MLKMHQASVFLILNMNLFCLLIIILMFEILILDFILIIHPIWYEAKYNTEPWGKLPSGQTSLGLVNDPTWECWKRIKLQFFILKMNLLYMLIVILMFEILILSSILIIHSYMILGKIQYWTLESIAFRSDITGLG